LIGTYSSLALLAHNLTQIKISAGVRAIIISLIFSIMLLLILRIFVRDWQRAAVACSLLLFLFFSYGYVYDYLERHPVFGLALGRHRWLAPIWLGLAIVAVWWAARRLRDVSNVSSALLIIGVVALAFPLVQTALFEVRLASSASSVRQPGTGEAHLQYTRGKQPPDIYYIILDAYAREDMLVKDISYDNASFLAQLGELGFYVADCSQSNYAQTELSLGSSLNFDYLSSLGDHFISGNTDRSDLWPLIKHGRVRQELEKLGYTIVAFETGYYWTQLEDADVYLSSSTFTMSMAESFEGINSFEVMWLETTGGLILADGLNKLPKAIAPDLHYPNRRHRQRVEYDLSQLKNLPLSVQSPKFVFVHMVIPHDPFVFGPNGEWVTYPKDIDPETYKIAYRDQVIYLNSRLIPLLKSILDDSSTPPIIILQADHGHGLSSHSGRMKIFNAYHLPGGGDQQLYETITPVNTFRVIFNYYFAGDFDLLEDASYFSTYDDPYNFTFIANDSSGCGQGN
jgi:hypothetical protein